MKRGLAQRLDELEAGINSDEPTEIVLSVIDPARGHIGTLHSLKNNGGWSPFNESPEDSRGNQA